jgi:hypothetical protein
MVLFAPLIFTWRALVGTCIQYNTKLLLGSPIKKETKIVKVVRNGITPKKETKIVKVVRSGITPGDLITIDEAVHAGHCSEDACKYGDPDCPVVFKEFVRKKYDDLLER